MWRISFSWHGLQNWKMECAVRRRTQNSKQNKRPDWTKHDLKEEAHFSFLSLSLSRTKKKRKGVVTLKKKKRRAIGVDKMNRSIMANPSIVNKSRMREHTLLPFFDLLVSRINKAYYCLPFICLSASCIFSWECVYKYGVNRSIYMCTVGRCHSKRNESEWETTTTTTKSDIPARVYFTCWQKRQRNLLHSKPSD